MPDRWGRPTLNDGLAIAEGVRSLQKFQQGLRDRAEQQEEKQRSLKDKAQIDAYTKTLMQGGELSPDSKDFNAANALAAQAKIFEVRNNDQVFRSNKLKLQKQKYEAEKQDINRNYAAAELVAKNGDKEKAAEMLVSSIYKYVPDGGTYKGVDENTGEWIFEDHYTGAENRLAPVPYEKAVEMAKQFSQNYEGISSKVDDTAEKHNIKEFQKKPEIWTDKKAKRKFAHYVLMDKKGRPRESWVDLKTGEIVKGFDPETKQTVEYKGELTPPAEKIKKEAAKSTGLKPKDKAVIREKAFKHSKKVEARLRDEGVLPEWQIKSRANKAYKDYYETAMAEQLPRDLTPFRKQVNRKTGVMRVLNKFGEIIREEGRNRKGSPYVRGLISRP